MSNQNGLTILGKQHQIGFPVTWLSALVDVGRALIDGDTPLDAIHRAPAFATAPTALAFPPRQVVPPAVVLGAADLGVDEPIDRLIADDLPSVLFLQSPGNLGWRPTLYGAG